MSLRSNLYKSARVLGTVNAASKGPTALGKRYIRKAVYRKTNSWTQKGLRKGGLW